MAGHKNCIILFYNISVHTVKCRMRLTIATCVNATVNSEDPDQEFRVPRSRTVGCPSTHKQFMLHDFILDLDPVQDIANYRIYPKYWNNIVLFLKFEQVLKNCWMSNKHCRP